MGLVNKATSDSDEEANMIMIERNLSSEFTSLFPGARTCILFVAMCDIAVGEELLT